ncbi:MAG: hypothetical protein AB7O49_20550 [Sphingomonadales bacterium]
MEDWLGLTIALIALVQPWLLYAYRELVQRGTRQLFPTGAIELGFSAYGSTLAIGGTLLAKHKSQIIRYFSVEIVRSEGDGPQIPFIWLLSRENQISGTISQGVQNLVSLKPQQALYIKSEEPQSFQIVFSDKDITENMQANVIALQNEWRAIPEVERQKYLKEDFTEFVENEVVKSFLNRLSSRLYWRKGRYHIHLKLHAEGGRSQSSSHTYEFAVTAEEEKIFLSNMLITLAEGVTGQSLQYQFVYKHYPQP